MAFKSYREESKTNYGHTENENATIEKVNCGSLQRIADAAEKMASNYTKLQSDLEMYKRWYNEGIQTIYNLERSRRSYKGTITKLKKQLTKQ